MSVQETMAILYDRELVRSDGLGEHELTVECYSNDTVKVIANLVEELGFSVQIISDTRRFGALAASGIKANICGCVNLGTGAPTAFRAGQAATFLEMAAIPYTGSDPQILLTCRDKLMTKRIAEAVGVTVPKGTFVSNPEGTFLDELHKELFPLFVKPNFESCSLGIAGNIVTTHGEVKKLSTQLLKSYPEGILIDEFIPGLEITVVVVGNGDQADIIPLVMREQEGEPLDMDFVRTYDGKATGTSLQKTRWFLAERYLPSAKLQELIAITRKLMDALRVRDFSRFDFRLATGGIPYFIECNGQPGIEMGNSLAGRVNKLFYEEDNGLQKAFLKKALFRMGLIRS